MAKLIPPLYFLTFIAYSCSSVNAIVIGIRVGVRVKVKVKVEVKVKGYIYVLYSRWAYKVFLVRLLFSQRSIILAVKLVQILLSLREVIIFFEQRYNSLGDLTR